MLHVTGLHTAHTDLTSFSFISLFINKCWLSTYCVPCGAACWEHSGESRDLVGLSLVLFPCCCRFPGSPPPSSLLGPIFSVVALPTLPFPLPLPPPGPAPLCSSSGQSEPCRGQTLGTLRDKGGTHCSVPGRAGGGVTAGQEGWALRGPAGPRHPQSSVLAGASVGACACLCVGLFVCRRHFLGVQVFIRPSSFPSGKNLTGGLWGWRTKAAAASRLLGSRAGSWAGSAAAWAGVA